MAQTGLKYFLDLTTIPETSVIAYYPFNQNSGNIIPTEPWCVSGYNGLLNNTSGFYTYSGTGNFNGNQWINISGFIPQEDWTAFIIYQKNRVANEFLFGTLQNQGGGNSGFMLGINQSNKIYMEFWNSVEGPQVITLPTVIGDKNVISVTKSDSSIFLRYFNANFKSWEGAFFIPYGNNFIDSSNWYIGGSPSILNTFPISNFSGQIDEFFLCSGNLLEEYQLQIASGFYAYKLPSGLQITTTCNPITYITGIVMATGSGITGFTPIVSSSITDACNNTLYFYDYSGVSGALSGLIYATYTGVSGCVSITGLMESGYYLDSGFLSTLGMNGVTIFYEPQAQDVLEFWAITGEFQDKTKNRFAVLDNVNNVYFTPIDTAQYDPTTFDTYLNGQWQLPSGYSTYQIGYSTAYILTGDYFLTGNNIESSGFYSIDNLNTIIYDVFSGARNARVISGANSGDTLAFFDFSNKRVFFNGQMLTSGIKYSAPNTILFDIPSGYNVVATIEKDADLIYFSGNNTGTFDTATGFLRETSQVWLNGVRLAIGFDYVESAIWDLLSGNYQLPDLATDVIYNSDDNFWNI